MTSPVSCPECGRQVPPQGLKLCPHCGYPLMLDHPAQVEQVPNKIVHKPQGPPEAPCYTMAMPPRLRPTAGLRPTSRLRTPAAATATRVHATPTGTSLWPALPSLPAGQPPARKRCEVCGAELWPGAAAPARWMPDPPQIQPARPRCTWWRTALAIGIPLAVIAGVWALALFL